MPLSLHYRPKLFTALDQFGSQQAFWAAGIRSGFRELRKVSWSGSRIVRRYEADTATRWFAE